MNKNVKFLKIGAIAIVASFSMAFGAVSDKCVKEVAELPNTKKDFNLKSFPVDLTTSIVKVKGLCKTKFTCPADNKMTDVGLTVGCVKQLPDDAKGIQTLLKDAGLEAGESAIQKME
jgi:hypothetical protein